MYRVHYYGHEKEHRSAVQAVKTANRMPRLYGEGNRPPAIDCDNDWEAKEVESLRQISNVGFSVQVGGIAVA